MSTEEIVIKKQKENLYKVMYSGFNGTVFVSTNRGELVDINFEVSSGSSISAKSLRSFPLTAVETLIRNKDNVEPSRVRPRLSRPKNLTEDFMKELSYYYLDALARNERPLVSIEQETKAPRNTVARWVATARKKGFLK
jgi:hypothetical protein